MDIEVKIVPGDVVYYRNVVGLSLVVTMSKIVAVTITLTETTENKIYSVASANGNINIAEGNITKDRKEAMTWVHDNLEAQSVKYKPMSNKQFIEAS